MNLVILHYHLNRGGVTSVIRNQIDALAGVSPLTDVLILHGTGTTGWPNWNQPSDLNGRLNRLEFQELPQLSYRDEVENDNELAKQIASAILNAGFEANETLVQIHNHNLGKNNSLMAAIPELVSHWGFKILLQVHDFAEDMRPDNFVAIRNFCQHNELDPMDVLYPIDSNIHFAFLNQRDLELVQGNFVPRSRCHLLPNPIADMPATEVDSDRKDNLKDQVLQALECENGDRLVVYPVRAIRRKNIGEALLFAASHPKTKVAITLPAVSEEEVTIYKQFKRMAKQWKLPVVFEAGQKGIEFVDLIAASDSILTTSVAEGFGMVFLESWCLGKQLIGRDLPSITHDFVEAGLNLNGLYQELKIPLDWFDINKERMKQQELLSSVIKQFELESAQNVELSLEAEQGWMDFAKLCHHTQIDVIEKVWQDDRCQSQLREMNPRFELSEYDDELVKSNANVVQEHFTQTAFRNRFQSVLDCLFKSMPTESKEALPMRPTQEYLVRAFLDPENFYPLRVESE